MKKCPRCNLPQAETTECEYCGLVFDNAKEAEQTSERSSAQSKTTLKDELENCKTCGNEVSSKAKTCPNCGAPVKAGCLKGCLTIIGIFFLIGLIGFIGRSVSPPTSKSTTPKTKTTVQKTNWRDRDYSTHAYVWMEGFVKKRLKSPKSAEFPGMFDGRFDHITYLGNQKYRIVSWVDSQNAFGATIRTHFIGEIEQVEESRFRLISLKFIKR